jgi:mannosyltransferase OCH1-like enzyme
MKPIFVFLFSVFCAGLFAVQTPEDVERLAFFASRSEQKAVSDRSVPKTFHWVWLGSAEVSQQHKENIRAWQEKHPLWRFVFWTDVEGRKAPISGVEVRQVASVTLQFLEKAFLLADDLGERTRLLAYEILYREGGVYLDVECRVCRSLDSLSKSTGFYCGLEQVTTSLLSSSVYPATHLMAACPGHEVLESAMRWLALHWEELEEKHPGRSPLCALSRAYHRTFWALSEGLERAGQEALVLPASGFSLEVAEETSYATYPCLGFGAAAEPKQLEKIIKKEKQNVWLLGTTLVLLLGSMLFRFVRWKGLLIVFGFLGFGVIQASEFAELTGKGTPCWHYLEEEKDVAFFTLCETLYTHRSPSLHAEPLIPRTIHFIWLGPHPFPPQSVENVRSWIAHHPEWKIKFWTDRVRDPPCTAMEVVFVDTLALPFLKKRYQSSSNWGEKSDILRLEILYQEGGVYVDHDVICLKSFDSLHSAYDFYAGLEVPHPPVMGRCLTAGNGVLGAKEGHPLLARVLALIEERWESLDRKYRGSDGYSQTQKVMERTYMALTEALEKGPVEQAVVLPAAYFFAKGKMEPVYCKHLCANTWAGSEAAKATLEQKKLRKLLKSLQSRSRLTSNVAKALFLLNLVAFVLVFYTPRRRKT